MARLSHIEWLNNYAHKRNTVVSHCVPLINDASFRCYFRVYLKNHSHSLILMDAPPYKEAIEPFIRIAQAFHANGIQVPKVIFADCDNGYALLSDLGSTTLQNVLTEKNAVKWYEHAFFPLQAIQQCQIIPNFSLQKFSQSFLQYHQENTEHWFFLKHLNYNCSTKEQQVLYECYQHWHTAIIQQPQVCVHRDYHCRNLMVTDESSFSISVIDFQDAMLGPISYDIVSLLRDCYVIWPEQLVMECISRFYAMLRQNQRLSTDITIEKFIQWFDYTGLYRHYRILGNRARLYHRDNKPAYLKDIPNLLDYIQRVSYKYNHFLPLYEFIEKKIKPQLATLSIF